MKVCSNPECREDIIKKITEVARCAKEKVPRAWLWRFLLIVGVTLISWGGSTWYTAKSAEEHVKNLQDTVKSLASSVAINNERTIRAEEKFEAINKNLEDIKRLVRIRNHNEADRGRAMP